MIVLTASAASAGAPDSSPMHRAGPEEIRDLALGAGDTKNQDEGYGELSPRDETWFGSTFWTGPDWTRVGKDWQHSGENTPSVRRWTAPRDGRVTITGRVYKADINNGGGDGVRLAIRHGRHEAWKAEINGDDTKGVEPNLTLEVRRGDAVRFVVHKRGAIPFDTTHWDPAVAYADGERFQASEGFSTQKQGQGVWSYEMERVSMSVADAPRVHAFGLDFALQSRAVEPDRPITLTPLDTLPVVVIADGSDKRGTVLALGPGPWRIQVAVAADGRLQVRLDDGSDAAGSTPAPGESPRLPEVAIGKYQGQWTRGMAHMQAFLRDTSGDGETGNVRRHVAESLDRAAARLSACPGISCGAGVSPAQAAGTAAPQYRGVDLGQALSADAATERPELDYWAMIQDEWRREDHLVDTPEAYAKATADHLAKAARLLTDLRNDGPDDLLAAEAGQLDGLAKAAQAASSPDDCRGVYLRVRWLKRRIALGNPKMQFGRLLFAKQVPPSYSHLVMQYYGFRARPGGGLFVLDQPGRSLACRDILDGRLAGGCVLEPRLSFDARRIVFSFVADAAKNYDPAVVLNDRDEGFYHVYEVNVDGTGLRQLTSGPYDDLMPTYLPDVGIAFCSTRRRGYARCFGLGFSRRWHVYTLHRMDGDGGNLRRLSAHDTNEWFPTVLPSGHLLYARWDYIDRDAVTHQNLWPTRPDGTNPLAVWGNAVTSPHCAFQAQPIPGSDRIVFTA
ncbi:MAG: hypothetical protein NTW96_05760, partial [Planctomycetia bacterium]|nr:hypothetical protein [Planctomycetia bacterium]